MTNITLNQNNERLLTRVFFCKKNLETASETGDPLERCLLKGAIA